MNQGQKRPAGKAGRGDAVNKIVRAGQRDHTPIASFVKGFIVNLALRGLLPCKAAEWLIQRGGLRHA